MTVVFRAAVLLHADLEDALVNEMEDCAVFFGFGRFAESLHCVTAGRRGKGKGDGGERSRGTARGERGVSSLT